MLPGTPEQRGGRSWVWLVAGLLVGAAVGASTMYLVKRERKTPVVAKLGEANELAMIPGDAVGFVHFRARDIWNSPQFAEFRKIVEKAGPDAVAALDENFVPAPSTLDRITLILLDNPQAVRQPRVGFDGRTVKPFIDPPAGVEPVGILAFNKTFDSAKVRTAIVPNAKAVKAGGREYWSNPARDLAVYFPSDQVLVVGTNVGVAQFVSRLTADGAPSPGPLARSIARAADGSRHFSGALNLKQFNINVAAIGNEVGAPVGTQAEMLQLAKDAAPLLAAEALDIGFVLGNDASKLDIRAYFKDDAAATEGEKAVRALTAFAHKALEKPREQLETMLKGPPGQPKPFPIEQLPMSAGALVGLGFLNTIDEFLAKPPLKREGSELVMTFDSPMVGSTGGTLLAASAVGVGLMLPAMQKVREAAARTTSSNNLKQIGLAMHNYASTYQDRLPPQNGVMPFNQNPKKNTQPLLSWRVHLLPFIEQDNLYKQFKLDEPWDSPNNKALIPMMPKTYMSPTAPAPPGQTYYKVFVGGGALFSNPNKYNISNIPDGTSNTIFTVEGGNPVTWTKPEDIPYDPKQPLPDLKLLGNTRILVGLADGSVRTIDLSRVSEKTLRNAITADDGQPLGSDW